MGRSTPHPTIMTRMIATPRLTIHALVSGPEAGVPVVLLHGNLSAATLWEETIHALPVTY